MIFTATSQVFIIVMFFGISFVSFTALGVYLILDKINYRVFISFLVAAISLAIVVLTLYGGYFALD